MLRSIFHCLLLLLPCSLPAQEKILDDYLAQGKKNSPLLYEYANQIKSLSLDSVRERAIYGFQVAANGNIMYAPVVHGWGYDPTITNGQDLSALMTVSRQITGREQLKTRLNSFTLEKKSVQAQAGLSARSLARQITMQYILCYGDQEQSRLLEEIFSVLQQEDDILRALTRSAAVKQTDYLTFKVALQQQALAREQANAQLLNDLADLNYMCGITDSALYILAPPDVSFSSPAAFDESIYALNFQADSLKIANNTALINLDYKPKVSFFADGGYQSALPAEAYKNWGVSTGINITLPLYDGKQRKTVLLQNKLAEDNRKKHEDFARQQYEQKKIQLIRQYKEYQQLTNTATEQMKYAATLVKANKQQLNAGDVRMADYLLSVNNYLNLRSQLIQYKMWELSILNDLNYLILK